MTVEIGVVLAGGTGSRLLPLTKVQNKHLLPVNGQPMLHWPLRTLAQLGVERAIVVLGGRSCGEVIEHFGTRYDTGDGALDLVYVHQQGAGGIPAALQCAFPTLEAMRADRVVVILGDNVFPALPRHLRGELDALDVEALVLAKPVPDATSYGCVAVRGTEADLGAGLVEKPTTPPPDGCAWAAVLGFYALPMFHLRGVLRGLVPSARRELEIVDVLDAYRGKGLLTVLPTTATWIDAGDPPGYRLANDPAFWTAPLTSDLCGLAERSA
jgi:glucose-1-phosphate thymidylyltransferase